MSLQKHGEIVTSDLSKFGARERAEIVELIQAWENQGLPRDFLDDEVTVAFNTSSGYVFLTNSEYQVAMLNDGKLESWYCCSYCGHEGFKDNMKHRPKDKECRGYLKQIGA